MVSTVRIGVDGVRVGHWTDPVARTGCTVVLLPPGTVASGEVRGGAPATREFALLAPDRLVEHVDAVVLTGGSAFGLAAADGVVDELAATGRGFPTGAGPVPIVVALGLFDLLVGDGSVRPGPAEGRAALRAAVAGPVGSVEIGAVGAGAGCTVGKWRGRDRALVGGLGGASRREGALEVAAVVAVNAFGDIDDGSAAAPRPLPATSYPVRAFGNTTIGVVVTNGRLDKIGAFLVAQGAHDGLARAVLPAHIRADGDAFVAAATGDVDAPVDDVRYLAVAVVEEAIRCVRAPG